jgi:hypothetical protein
LDFVEISRDQWTVLAEQRGLRRRWSLWGQRRDATVDEEKRQDTSLEHARGSQTEEKAWQRKLRQNEPGLDS